MYNISFFINLLVVAGLVLLGIVSMQNSRNSANRYFGVICFALAGWATANYFADANLANALIWTRITFASITIALTTFVIFANRFPQRTIHARGFEAGAYCAGVVTVVLALTPYMVPSVEPAGASSTVVTGPLYFLFLIFFVTFLCLGSALLVRSMRRLKGLNALRIRLVLFGIVLMAIFSSMTNLVLPLILKENSLARFGAIGALLFTGITTYAIARHKLFNVRLVVARSIMYSLTLASVTGLYALALFGVTQYLFITTPNSRTENIVSTVLAVILAFTFQPLRQFFEKITDRIFYRDRYDSQVVLNNFSGILVSELDLDRILKRTLADICTQLHIQFGQVIVYNDERVYRIEHHGPLPNRLMVAPELKHLNHGILVADELPDGDRKQIMEEHGIRVSLTLRTREEFIGHLLLGDKLSGDIYSSQDIEILEILSKQLAVAIQNAKSYAEIQEFNQTLQARVDHATSRLRVANRHLKELDKTKDEFISMASHQLRTPLTTIKGYLSMMLEGDAGKMTKTQSEFAGYAFGSSERMVNLISDLLNVSRLSAGRFIIQTKPTDMVGMIRDEVRQLENHAKAKHLKLIFDEPKEALPLAEIDDNKTRQVVMNFIDNAIYYTPSGNVTVHLDQTGERVRLRVTDTGIGVPEEAKKKLFSKFYRADNAQSVRPDGTGLGLYLARRVVEDQGGTILFESTIGKGSMFGFELPLTSPTSVNEAPHG